MPVNETVGVSAGTARVDYRIRVIGTDGSGQGNFMVINASDNMVEYASWYNATYVRIVNHMYVEYGDATSIVGVRKGFAL